MPIHFLFDIDGTLISSCPPHGRSMIQALKEVYGVETSTQGMSLGGMTDWQIARELLLKAGLSLEEIDARMPAFIEHTSNLFDAAVQPSDLRELPQAIATVKRLQREGHLLSLVTGNFIRIAYRKIELVGLGGLFPVGGFGSDHHHRPELPRLAIQRANSHYRTDHSRAFMIGDTVRDIEAGQVNGIPVIAVATGRHFGVDQLRSAGATHALKDLSEFPWEILEREAK